MFFGMENPFLASVFTHMIWIFLYRKWPFSLCNRKPKNYFPETISHSHGFDRFLCFLGAESDSGICFYPSRLDFAVPEVAIFQYAKE